MLGQDTIISCLDDCSGLSPKWSWHFHPCPCLFSVGQPETINHVTSLPCSKSSNAFSLCWEWNPRLLPQPLGPYVIGSWILLHPNLLSVPAPAWLVWGHRNLLQGLCTCCTLLICSSFQQADFSVSLHSNLFKTPLHRGLIQLLSEAVSSLFPILLDF